MRIKQNKNSKTKKKFPLRIYLDSGRVIPVPSQHHFKSDFIQHHGCSLVGFYMALRYKGIKKNMQQVLRYSRRNLRCYAKYPLSEVVKGINHFCSGSPATYYRNMNTDRLRRLLHRGCLALFEEGDPIHTVVLLYDARKKTLYRFSDGKKSVVSTAHEMKNKCTSDKYKGIVTVK